MGQNYTIHKKYKDHIFFLSVVCCSTAPSITSVLPNSLISRRTRNRQDDIFPVFLQLDISVHFLYLMYDCVLSALYVLC